MRVSTGDAKITDLTSNNRFLLIKEGREREGEGEGEGVEAT